MSDLLENSYWPLRFDAAATVDDKEVSTLIDKIRASGTKDLFLMSHGWGQSSDDAARLYNDMFPLIRAAPGTPSGARFIGVSWPSIWFPDPAPQDRTSVAEAVAAGAPGQADAALTGTTITAALSRSMPDAAPALQQMGEIIDHGLAAVADGTSDPEAQGQAVNEFHSLFTSVFRASVDGTEDGGESALITSTEPLRDYQTLAKMMGSEPPTGDTQGIGDIFGKVWNGAKDALRIGSYYQMKARAGDIGRRALGPFLTRLNTDCPKVRVHLIGHSFGARLVSFALAGIPTAEASPVASLTLVQGAFSHWAFTEAADNPFGEPGALCRFADRVHGPLVATYTKSDWAIATWYPKASFLAGQDAQGKGPAGRWAGMGFDGFQNVQPSGDVALPLTTDATLHPGHFYRVDSTKIIKDTSKDPFAGAHSDIAHPEVASLIVAAAGRPG